MNYGELVVALLAVLGSFASIVSIITALRYRTAALTDLQKLKDQDLKEAKDRLEALTTEVKVSFAEQAIINRFLAESLQCETLKEAFVKTLKKSE